MAADSKVATLQDNLYNQQANSNRPQKSNDDLTNYSYWLSGANSRRAALEQYDLMRTGYVRIFFLAMPRFVDILLPSETKKFKHMLEFGNVGIDGIQGFSVETTQATGGFAGNSVELPTGSKDDTNSITIKVYETQESLIRTYIDFWITGTFDPVTGLNHYFGARDENITGQEAKTFYFSQANHTAEALVVAMDPTGDNAIYSALITNMFPKQSDHSHFNFDPGSHELVQLSLEFTANKYLGSQINYLGQVALDQFKILKNFMLTYSGYTKQDIQNLTSGVDITEWGGPFKTESGSLVPSTGNPDRRVDGVKKGEETKYAQGYREYVKKD